MKTDNIFKAASITGTKMLRPQFPEHLKMERIQTDIYMHIPTHSLWFGIVLCAFMYTYILCVSINKYACMQIDMCTYTFIHLQVYICKKKGFV